MLVFTVLLTLFITVFFTAVQLYENRRVIVQRGEARVTVEKLSGTANELCRTPAGTKQTVQVTIPSLVNPGLSSITAERITLQLTGDTVNESITAVTDCSVTGTLPDRSGVYHFQGKRRKTDVLLNWSVIR